MRNGVAAAARVAVSFPGGSFAPTRVAVAVRGCASVRVAGEPPRPRVRGARAGRRPSWPRRATPALDGPAQASGGGYDGPLAYRMGKGMRPDVAAAFDRMAAAARRDGIYLSITSAFRSDAEQARLFAANPNPKWVAPPGTSLHRYATELDLGPPGAYAWLAANARRSASSTATHGRHGTTAIGANPRDREHPAQYERGSWEPPGGDHGRIQHRLPSFVPPRFQDPIAQAALRWNVPMELLAAQLYAESGFNPFAESAAGARGIAQFMPGTARRVRAGRPARPGRGDRRAGAPDERSPEAVRRQGGAGAGGVQRRGRGGGALRRRSAVRRDARVRGEDPRAARRSGSAAGGRHLEIRLVE